MMNKRIVCLILPLVLLTGSITYAQTQRSAAVKQTWEYRVVEAPASAQKERTLNQLGADGWELVAVEPYPSGVGSYILKRPR